MPTHNFDQADVGRSGMVEVEPSAARPFVWLEVEDGDRTSAMVSMPPDIALRVARDLHDAAVAVGNFPTRVERTVNFSMQLQATEEAINALRETFQATTGEEVSSS